MYLLRADNGSVANFRVGKIEASRDLSFQPDKLEWDKIDLLAYYSTSVCEREDP